MDFYTLRSKELWKNNLVSIFESLECQAKNEIYPVGIGNRQHVEQGHDIIDSAFLVILTYQKYEKSLQDSEENGSWREWLWRMNIILQRI